MINNFSRLDDKKRFYFLRNELKLIKLKSIYNDLSLSKTIRSRAHLKLAQLINLGKKQKIKNRCIISSRGKGVYKKFGISRINLRLLGHQGFILGLSKASW